jgi:hypothetical protein
LRDLRDFSMAGKMMNRHSSTAKAQRIDAADEDDADHADYRRMIERFDYLWAAAPSQRGQQEMQQLLPRIEQYETEQHEAEQYEAAHRDGAIQIAGAERKSAELPRRITVAANPST